MEEIQFPILDGVKFYLCGGAVRDILLGKEPKDLDFVMLTNKSYDEVVKGIEKIGTVFLQKPEFLTIRCRLQEQIYDLVFPRGDGYYEDSRHPSNVVRLASLEEDSKRRDFTINAMYMDNKGNIIDPLNGKASIERGRISTCGNPIDRFNEDPLRMLRALRFSIQLGFDIDKECKEVIEKNAYLLNNISVDRIRDEINKMLLKSPIKTVSYLYEYEFMPIICNKSLNFQVTNKRIKGIN